MSHNSTSPMNQPLLDLIPDNLDGYNILDCGFGYGEWGFMIRTRKNGTPHIIGVDIFKPYCEKQKNLRIYDEIHCIDVLEIDKYLKTNYHIIIVSELVEHVKKNDGLKLIEMLEKICTNLLIITTPQGPTYHNKHVDGNKHNTHISEWKDIDFKKMGFSIKLVDKKPLPQSIRILDMIRRYLLKLKPVPKQIIAWKILHNGRNVKDA